ncbi:MAG: hypothetical protein CL846_07750 [Crocinitomicaceae bacterium]|nr:hypothetical protein [Crocinitomicaceae bacterium]|tara:strand:- start:6472 stop:6987 length:516 start_codon:yes stop_codon:yes gene_type:complete
MKTKKNHIQNLKITLLTALILICSFYNVKSQTINNSVSENYESYKQEIKKLFEKHYEKEFKSSPEMKIACIDYVERQIDNKEDTVYKTCNYFVNRRFKTSTYKNDKNISLNDILLADWRLEFVEDNLNNPKFHNPIADKINVELGEYEGYFYVVVGIHSSWYEKNENLLTY